MKRSRKSGTIDDYFTKIDPIFRERLEEEIESENLRKKSNLNDQTLCDEENGAGEIQQNSCGNGLVSVGNLREDEPVSVNLEEIAKKLSKEVKELKQKNAKLINDNKALKRLLESSQRMNLQKDVKI